MELSTFLLFAVLGMLGYVAWQLAVRGKESGEVRMQRELLENLRREIAEARERDREHLQERLDTVSRQLSDGMNENARSVMGQFKQSTDIVREVTEKLTKIDETNKQVLGFTEQLKEFENILRNPKSRGLISEYWLETMLSHVLPPGQYSMQYGFPNGEVVDAVVHVRDKVVPIDAKFSSERFNRIVVEKDKDLREKLEKAFRSDLKSRIDETSKYIRPEEGTTDFAFMFLPSDGIYHDLLVHRVGSVEVNKVDLIEYGFSKRVVIVSPTTFFAYLQTVLQGLKALKVEESMQDILKKVHTLGKHIAAYEEYMKKMGNHLGTTVNSYNTAYKELGKIDKDVVNLTDGESGGAIEPLLVEKPSAHVS